MTPVSAVPNGAASLVSMSRKPNDNRTKDTSPRERGDRSVGDGFAGRVDHVVLGADDDDGGGG
jgi:hypothetical protein